MKRKMFPTVKPAKKTDIFSGAGAQKKDPVTYPKDVARVRAELNKSRRNIKPISGE